MILTIRNKLRLSSRRLLFTFFALNLPIFPTAAKQNKQVVATVESFYAWYVAQVGTDDSSLMKEHVIRRKPSILSARLRHEMAVDVARNAKPSGVIEGIDFDPFLGNQDPCPRFVMGKSRRRARRYLVDVKPICEGTISPPVTVILLQTRSGPVIDDVRYSDGTTLRQAFATTNRSHQR